MFYLSCQTITIVSEFFFFCETAREVMQETQMLIDRNYQLLLSLPLKSLKSKKKKLALTVLFYASREIWLGNSKKVTLHRRIKILHFLTTARIQKCLT